MVMAARKVLADCKNTHRFIEHETDATRFRVFWVAGVALLRAVGHVLHKVDARQNARMKDAIHEAYQGWKKDKEANAIFWEFIERERNTC